MATFEAEKLGPGTLKIGETGTEIDISCQITGARVEWDETADDDTPTLCGDVVPGARTYAAKLSGTVFQDLTADGGIVEFSWANKGTVQPFLFVPLTEGGKQVSGDIVIGPLRVGGDNAGENMTSDFEWACAGEPALDPVAGP